MSGWCVLVGQTEQGLVCDTRAGAPVTATLLKHSEWEDHLHPIPSFLLFHCLICCSLCYSCSVLCSNSICYISFSVCVRSTSCSSLVCCLWFASAQWVIESNGWPDLVAYPMLHQSTPLFFSSSVHSCHYCTVFLVIHCKVLTYVFHFPSKVWPLLFLVFYCAESHWI